MAVDPNALAPEDAARLLSKAIGQRVSEEMIRADMEAGAPANADGTLSLALYAAWLLKETGRGD